MTWEGLNPPYSTIVADPPWRYDEGWPPGEWSSDKTRRKPLGYSSLGVADIAELPVPSLAAADAHLYLWTTNRYLRDAFGVAEAWGFVYSATIVWAKPLMGWQPGGAYGNSAEYVLFCRRGSLKTIGRENSAFMDMVERVSPGPYVEKMAGSFPRQAAMSIERPR